MLNPNYLIYLTGGTEAFVSTAVTKSGCGNASVRFLEATACNTITGAHKFGYTCPNGTGFFNLGGQSVRP